MKLRLIKVEQKLKLLCPNGSIINATPKVLSRLLCNFKAPTNFKGTDGCWNATISDMEKYIGQTVAIVDDNMSLVVYDESVFKCLCNTDVEYISVTEYANLHKKSRAMVKQLCSQGRLPGIQKHSTGWLIPSNTPYPKRKKREVKPREN